MSLRRHVAAAAAAGGLIASLLGGCGGGVTTLAIPTPPPTVPSTPTTLAPLSDLTGVRQQGVPGATTTTLPAIGPGAASIDGSVLGPSGPVAGATVQAERVVGGALAATEAMTGADGSFTIAGVLGGIYRVRAWQAPSLASIAPQTFFLGATDTHQLSLTLSGFSVVEVKTSMAPDHLEVGEDANLVVAVSSQAVGPDGVVRPQPIAGQSVVVEGGGAWLAITADPAMTDARGLANFELTCEQAGAPPLVAAVAGAAPATVTSSACVAPPPTTTTTSTLPGLVSPPGPATSPPASGPPNG